MPPKEFIKWVREKIGRKRTRRPWESVQLQDYQNLFLNVERQVEWNEAKVFLMLQAEEGSIRVERKNHQTMPVVHLLLVVSASILCGWYLWWGEGRILKCNVKQRLWGHGEPWVLIASSQHAIYKPTKTLGISLTPLWSSLSGNTFVSLLSSAWQALPNTA